MQEAPIVFRVPPECPHCGAEGRVRLQQTVKASHVIMKWRCTACNTEWVGRQEEDEHRSA